MDFGGEAWDAWNRRAEAGKASATDSGALREERMVKDLQGMAQKYRYSLPYIAQSIDNILLRSLSAAPAGRSAEREAVVQAAIQWECAGDDAFGEACEALTEAVRALPEFTGDLADYGRYGKEAHDEHD
jgi:cytochrome c5